MDLMMKATFAFVTPFNFRWKEGGTETLRSGAKKKLKKKKSWLEQLMWEGAARVLQEITNVENLLHKFQSSIVPPLPLCK